MNTSQQKGGVSLYVKGSLFRRKGQAPRQSSPLMVFCWGELRALVLQKSVDYVTVCLGTHFERSMPGFGRLRPHGNPPAGLLLSTRC